MDQPAACAGVGVARRGGGALRQGCGALRQGCGHEAPGLLAGGLHELSTLLLGGGAGG